MRVKKRSSVGPAVHDVRTSRVGARRGRAFRGMGLLAQGYAQAEAELEEHEADACDRCFLAQGPPGRAFESQCRADVDAVLVQRQQAQSHDHGHLGGICQDERGDPGPDDLGVEGAV